MIKDSREKLSPLTIRLHWIVALFIIAMIALGIYMDEFEARALYPIHKSLGVIALVIIAVRVWWRAINGWPQPVREYQRWEQQLAKVVHWLLIIGILLFPISGMMMSGMGGHGISVFGLELVASHIDPETKKAVALNKDVAKAAGALHGLLGKLFIVLIAIHIAGAVKHHWIDKDNTLKRMLGR